MVDISDKLAEIKKLVDDGKYFTINRARQYGKTTTIAALCNAIQKDYFIINDSGCKSPLFHQSSAWRAEKIWFQN